MQRERPDRPADNPLDTKRFAFHVGRRCRGRTARAIAEALHSHRQAVKDLDERDMGEQPRRAGCPAPRVIGVDAVAVGARPGDRIVGGDRERGGPIRFGGKGRSEAGPGGPSARLGPKECREVRAAVMGMRKAFGNSTLEGGHAPRARVIDDTPHAMSHLGGAMDGVRRRGYARLTGEDRRFIKGQRPGWARRFLTSWRDALRRRRSEPLRKSAAMVEGHWDWIEAHCHEEDRVPPGFVEGLDNEVRAIRLRAYGYRDEGYFRLKILTCMLPKP